MIHRILENSSHLGKGKAVILIGPRQEAQRMKNIGLSLKLIIDQIKMCNWSFPALQSTQDLPL